jgi:hypothetical protein
MRQTADEESQADRNSSSTKEASLLDKIKDFLFGNLFEIPGKPFLRTQRQLINDILTKFLVHSIPVEETLGIVCSS